MTALRYPFIMAELIVPCIFTTYPMLVLLIISV